MNEIYLYIGIGALIIIAIGIMTSKKFKGKLTKKGLSVESDNSTSKDETKIKKIRNQSDLDVESPENRNIDIRDVDNSKIKIKK